MQVYTAVRENSIMFSGRLLEYLHDILANFPSLQSKTKKAKVAGASASAAASDEEMIPVSIPVLEFSLILITWGIPHAQCCLIFYAHLSVAVCKEICKCARVQGQAASQHPGVL